MGVLLDLGMWASGFYLHLLLVINEVAGAWVWVGSANTLDLSTDNATWKRGGSAGYWRYFYFYFYLEVFPAAACFSFNTTLLEH